MPQVTYVMADGSRRIIDTPVGTSVMQTAIQNDIRGIEAECGGCLSCATCHVYVEPESIVQPPAPQPMESELLDIVAAERKPNSRLSCQILMVPELHGLVVRIPERQA